MVSLKTEQPTLGQLRDAIPDHCFERSATRSLLYVARDVLYAGVLIYAASYIDSIPTGSLRVVAWTLYTFLQGCVGTGLWILAHECGHGAFSPSTRLNNFVGWALHSALMVPYYSWKITHARHHRYTGHLTRDTAFVPYTESEFMESRKLSVLDQVHELIEETPLATSMAHLLGHQLFGWQMYMFRYVSAGKESIPGVEDAGKARNLSHYAPNGTLWVPGQGLLIFLTDLGLLLTASVWGYVGWHYGWQKVVLLYVIPYFWVHHWLVAITYLHHTHPSVPHFSPEKWSFTSGALCTVDRSFGFIGRHFMHEIIDYHVVHHLFPRIPFYHAQEATEAIQPLLQEHYHETKDESFLGSLVDTFHRCWYVSEDCAPGERQEGVYWWQTGKAKTQ
ncbi:fatty acid desaturase-domain-containing protein [Aspergillus taichungensis]|uniref:Fatty acid desaturase-domain-containing protein n=1 Tax=Aspergillus taichungensis TaxID=482145 RepID=A0A2J5HMQ9_9EURO|nr:fatty acid desaturase-domain-containing protein [Aspergillus taichungensis]